MFSLLLRSRPAGVHVARVSLPKYRSLSTTSPTRTNRAIVYSQNGNPAEVLSVLTYPSLAHPTSGTVNIRYLLSPINPADVNVVEGVYPSKPTLTSNLVQSGKGSKDEPVFIGGNEGLAQVTSIGENVDGLNVGDWVVMVKQQAGTWSASQNVNAQDIVKIPNQGLSEVHAATITVNPPTAYNMLMDYVELQEGDWVMQNGANSAVGQAVIQIAAARGLKTLNFVRNRDDISQLKDQLRKIGATQVLTYDDLNDKSLRDKVKTWLGGKEILLALNCVGKGGETTEMLRYMGKDGHLVSYGAMSKQPLSLPTSAFIFKNLTAHGFWQSRWYLVRSRAEREQLMATLTSLMKEGKLAAPEHEVVSIDGQDSDGEATTKIRNVFQRLAAGRYGKKVLLKFDE
ncbi:hypothetical protein D9756_002526 [Leucocoprinus leucothites]|uniref:enoyl-[acyl-carrier-protein] reductase n=1 Tax=Leucocoprinus leucothites TaxID=201217 RepID=A0A8H5LM68_9AGAR|nr:hypothetical protein D9756_002526 [Leucoagaricus leucothites]